MTSALRNEAPTGTRARQLAARREQFIAAAERLFLRDGFAKTSVNAIVREAGGSLATLYAEFGTKEALFESVLSQRVDSFFPAARARQAPGSRDARADLHAFATRMLQQMLSDDGLAVYRICIHEAPRFAGLRHAVLDLGMPQLMEGTVHHLGEIAGAHGIHFDDPALAASRFIALLQGQLVVKAACGARIDSRMRTHQVNEAIDAFLILYPPHRQIHAPAG